MQAAMRIYGWYMVKYRSVADSDPGIGLLETCPCQHCDFELQGGCEGFQGSHQARA